MGQLASASAPRLHLAFASHLTHQKPAILSWADWRRFSTCIDSRAVTLRMVSLFASSSLPLHGNTRLPSSCTLALLDLSCCYFKASGIAAGASRAYPSLPMRGAVWTSARFELASPFVASDLHVSLWSSHGQHRQASSAGAARRLARVFRQPRRWRVILASRCKAAQVVQAADKSPHQVRRRHCKLASTLRGPLLRLT